MGHIQDRWTKPGDSGRRVKSDRYGIGKRWSVVWDEAGRRRTESFEVKQAAEKRLAAIVTQQAEGTYVAKTATTLAEYGDQWIRAQIHQRASTATQMESRWRVHIRPKLGDTKLSELSRGQVQAAVLDWSDKLAPATVGVIYAYLSAMLKSAVHDRLIRETPCVKINLPRVEREKVVPITVAQVHRIAAEVHPRYRAAILLGAATGMRSGEIRGLTSDRLSFVDGLLRVRVDRQLVTTEPTWGPPKTSNSDRTIAVGEQTAEMMRDHLARFAPHPSGLIFTGREGGPMARGTASQVWNDATVGMVLKNRSGWHELRHHHASLLIAAGLSVTAVADRLGHQDSTETLRTYAHLWLDDEDRAREVVERSLWAPGVPVVNETSEQPQSRTLRLA